tara:strand:- start:11230 stop:12426 length:1197 start_codon:yes stop_codon:yes gene_type:complete
MAISIDTVYQRVLAIANKEQRGYITPQEFNLFANQAQLEIFEQYFYDINQFSRTHGNDTEYSDMLEGLDEKISIFKRNQTTLLSTTNTPGYLATFGANLVTNGTFDDDIASFTAGVSAAENGGSQSHDAGTGSLKLENDAANNVFRSTQAVATTAGTLYRAKASVNTGSLNTSGNNATANAGILFNGVPSATLGPGFNSTLEVYASAVGNFTNLKLFISGNGNTGAADFALFDNVEVAEVSSRKLSLNSDIYRLGTILFTNSSGEFVEVDKVLPNELVYVNSSPLTKPSTSNPVYVLEKNSTGSIGSFSVSLYPSSVGVSSVSYNYIAKPTQCNWGYTVVNEQAMYDAASSTNFELHESEVVTIVNKILELAGVAMQKQDIQGFATGKDNKEVQQEKS